MQTQTQFDLDPAFEQLAGIGRAHPGVLEHGVAVNKARLALALAIEGHADNETSLLLRSFDPGVLASRIRDPDLQALAARDIRAGVFTRQAIQIAIERSIRLELFVFATPEDARDEGPDERCWDYCRAISLSIKYRSAANATFSLRDRGEAGSRAVDASIRLAARNAACALAHGLTPRKPAWHKRWTAAVNHAARSLVSALVSERD